MLIYLLFGLLAPICLRDVRAQEGNDILTPPNLEEANLVQGQLKDELNRRQRGGAVRLPYGPNSLPFHHQGVPQLSRVKRTYEHDPTGEESRVRGGLASDKFVYPHPLQVQRKPTQLGLADCQALEQLLSTNILENANLSEKFNDMNVLDIEDILNDCNSQYPQNVKIEDQETVESTLARLLESDNPSNTTEERDGYDGSVEIVSEGDEKDDKGWGDINSQYQQNIKNEEQETVESTLAKLLESDNPSNTTEERDGYDGSVEIVREGDEKDDKGWGDSIEDWEYGGEQVTTKLKGATTENKPAGGNVDDLYLQLRHWREPPNKRSVEEERARLETRFVYPVSTYSHRLESRRKERQRYGRHRRP